MGELAPELILDSAESASELDSFTSGQVQASSVLRLEVPCDLSAVRRVVASVCLFLAEKGVSETELIGCELALVEACNNAILYAERQKAPAEIYAYYGK